MEKSITEEFKGLIRNYNSIKNFKESKIQNINFRKSFKIPLINKETILNIIKELKNTNSISLIKIKEKYDYINPNSKISVETIRKYLRKILKFTYRKQKTKKFSADSIICWNMKHIFIKKICKIFENNNKIIYLDEATFSFHIKPQRSWFESDSEFDGYQSYSFKSVQLLLCANTDGILFYDIRQQTYKGENFMNFLKKNKHHFKKGKINFIYFKIFLDMFLYLDNAPCHIAKLTMNYCYENEINLVYGVPDCPEFNIIEYVFSDLKKKYYRGIFINR